MSKLLYITTNLQGSGGVSRVLSVKLDYLIEKYGYTIHVVTTNNKEDNFFYVFNDKIVFHKIDIKKINVKNLFKYKKSIQTIFEKINPDIIINCDNGLKGSLLTYFVKKNIPLVYEMHGSKNMVYNKYIDRIKLKLSNYILDKNIKTYKYFVVLTDGHTKEWKSDNIRVINNPITIFSSTLKQKGLKVVLAVGRFSFEKGYFRLLEIWDKIVGDNPDWTLEIYGAGDKSVYLERLKKIEHFNSVKLKEPVNNIEEVYAKASFLVNTSFSEALPLTIIEGLHKGLPVIAFETVGAKELISNGVNGYLITQNDTRAFIEKMNLLINKEEELLKKSAQAVKSVNKYNIDIVMEQWHKLFQRLV